MYAVAVSLVSPDGKTAGHLPDADVASFFRERATEPHSLEHVRARASATGIDLVLFLSAAGGVEAELAAVELCRRVITGRQELTGWTVGSSGPLDLRL